jgi:hypothetical protein
MRVNIERRDIIFFQIVGFLFAVKAVLALLVVLGAASCALAGSYGGKGFQYGHYYAAPRMYGNIGGGYGQVGYGQVGYGQVGGYRQVGIGYGNPGYYGGGGLSGGSGGSIIPLIVICNYLIFIFNFKQKQNILSE